MLSQEQYEIAGDVQIHLADGVSEAELSVLAGVDEWDVAVGVDVFMMS